MADITIDVPLDEPEITIVSAEDNTPAITDNPAEGIAELQRQLAEEREARKRFESDAVRARQEAAEEARRRSEAERFAQDNQNRANSATVEAQQREYESIVNATAAETSTLHSLRQDFIKAQTDGDFERAADIQIKIGRTSARLESLEQGKEAIETSRKNAPTAPQQPAGPRETQAQFNDRPWNMQEAEAVMRQSSYSTANWMRANPRYFSDPAFRKQVHGADQVIRGRGVAPDTDDYFKGVEEILGLSTPATQTQPREEKVSTAGKTNTGRTTAAAPPSRTAPDSSGQAPSENRVTLTEAQRKQAALMFPKMKPTDPDPDVVYARNWLALKREGKLKDGGIII